MKYTASYIEILQQNTPEVRGTLKENPYSVSDWAEIPTWIFQTVDAL
jgi:hypothetical protein